MTAHDGMTEETARTIAAEMLGLVTTEGSPKVVRMLLMGLERASFEVVVDGVGYRWTVSRPGWR